MSETISPAQKRQLENMLEMLTGIYLHPKMWITTVPNFQAFISGFSIAAKLLGINIEQGREQIWAERGWETGRSTTPILQMQEKGWSEDAIISETILMMMINIRRRFELTGQKIFEMHDEIRQRHLEGGREVSPELAQQMESLEQDLGITRNH
ncbi:MAG: hypothetical protein ABI690_10450 [Chloroflexota bacterium]